MGTWGGKRWAIGAVSTLLIVIAGSPAQVVADDYEAPVERVYVATPPAPRSQTREQAAAKSAGCISCHSPVDAASMHASPAVVLGCVDCHGGDAAAIVPAGASRDTPEYNTVRDRAHVLPRYPGSWHFPSSANPERTYTLLNREAPEFIRFVNPGDYRASRQSCGNCHMELIERAERSLMATGAMFFGGASYNNGILPYKNYIIGEAYTPEGEPARLLSPGTPPGTVTLDEQRRGALPVLYPIPTWQVTAAVATSLPSSRKSACPVRPARSSGWRSRGVRTSASRRAAPAPACASPCRS